MTTTKPDAVNYCEECKLEYAGHRCDPCPLCPLNRKLAEAESELHKHEPWRVVARETAHEVQQTINSLEAHGWSYHDLKAGHGSELIVLMERRDYSPERHAEAADRVTEALAECLAKRREVEVVTGEYQEARLFGAQ